MAEADNRGKLSEMEQIHRGLEEFLEKEVYEEYASRSGVSREKEYNEKED